MIESGNACGPNLAGAANPHGVVEIVLAQPLTDPDSEVLAEVRDLAGNSRQLQLTVGELLRAARSETLLFRNGFEP